MTHTEEINMLRDEFNTLYFDDLGSHLSANTRIKLFDWFLFKLTQAKAEQREEDARIAKVIKDKGSDLSYDFGEDFDVGFEQACDDIAKKIREGKI